MQITYACIHHLISEFITSLLAIPEVREGSHWSITHYSRSLGAISIIILSAHRQFQVVMLIMICVDGFIDSGKQE